MEIIVFNRRWVVKARVWICVLIAIAILSGLAYWQLQRADEKIRLQSQLARQAETEPLAIDILQAFPLMEADGLPVAGRARWLAPKVWLLDNQMVEGRIGYDVIIPVRIGRDSQPMLVNLGWIAAPTDRSELPKVNPPAEFDVRGLLRTRLGNFSLGQNLEDSKRWPMRMQRVEIKQLNAFMHEPLYSGLIYQLQLSPYKIHYQPMVISPERHRAYAIQWALLALAVFIVAIAASAAPKSSLTSANEAAEIDEAETRKSANLKNAEKDMAINFKPGNFTARNFKIRALKFSGLKAARLKPIK